MTTLSQNNSQMTTAALPTTTRRPRATRRTATNRVLLDHVFSSDEFKLLLMDGPENPSSFQKQIETLPPLVLHVDDDADLVDAVTSRLVASGFRVASALDGETGVKVALLNPADAIVLDYDMPNGKGDTVIDLLKGNSKTRDIPIIVLTAVHKRGLKRELLSRGADAFLTKPFDYRFLESTILNLISPTGL